ncbi:3'-5' exonuclease [Falsiroseomonas sp.]|uniref:3'-5' exonuclease n=1 Tax=Falsiroseomonas sp. TaxID=2870721 RepID=UPI0027356A73|nr:3'-5' exonuclease [Falsiroseomonas sp.]MDP3414628.1 3'-5' exonuclease [Falsiroseomonas sp.]
MDEDQASGDLPQTDWVKHLPDQILFFDVETTGIGPNDRIVAFAAIMLDWSLADQSRLSTKVMNFVFDPGIRSHPEAEAIHGMDDWFLRHQEPFSKQAAVIAEFVSGADLIVSHNIDFDYLFLLRDLSAAGIALPRTKAECTMRLWANTHRLRYRPSLNAIASEIGLPQREARHSAMEDAWLCMVVWLYLKTPWRLGAFPGGEAAVRKNVQPVPQRPDGRLPPRRRAV